MSERQFVMLVKVLMIASAVATLIGIGYLPLCYRRADSMHWPTTPGVVGNIGLQTSSQKPGRPAYFTPFVSYSYVVDGIPRVSTRIDFADGRPRFTKEEALLWLNRNYPVGKQVTVYYDSTDPDLAILVPGASDLIFLGWTVAITTALAFGACILLLRRRKREMELKNPVRL